MTKPNQMSYEQTSRQFRGLFLQGLEAARIPVVRRAILLESESRLGLKSPNAYFLRRFNSLDKERFYTASSDNVCSVYRMVYEAEKALQAEVYGLGR